MCSVRLPKINQIGSWPVSLVGWLPWHAWLLLPWGMPAVLLWGGGVHLPWILLQWLYLAICGYLHWCKHKQKARAFNSYPEEIFAFVYGQGRKRQGVGKGITNQIKRSAQFLMLNISGVGKRQNAFLYESVVPLTALTSLLVTQFYMLYLSFGNGLRNNFKQLSCIQQ